MLPDAKDANRVNYRCFVLNSPHKYYEATDYYRFRSKRFFCKHLRGKPYVYFSVSKSAYVLIQQETLHRVKITEMRIFIVHQCRQYIF